MDHAARADLRGRRVVITRAAEQADDLTQLVAAAGGVPVVVPMVELVGDAAGVRQLAAWSWDEVDWLVVTSPNAAKAVIAHATPVPRRVQVAAVGASTAACMDEGGVPVTLIPARQRGQGLVEELPAGSGRVLVVQAAGAAPTVTDGLRAKGWAVQSISPYRTVAATVPDDLRATARAADVVLFASGSAAQAWAAMLAADTDTGARATGDPRPTAVVPDDVERAEHESHRASAAPDDVERAEHGPLRSSAPPGIKHVGPLAIAIGPECASAARRAGITVAAVAPDHSLAGLVRAAADLIAELLP